jgi:copper chaperone CopZ
MVNPSTADGIVTTKFAIGMTCEGCANACKRICGKIEGITSVDANVAEKMLTITTKEGGDVTSEDVLAKLVKWGEAANKTVALA